MKPKTAVLTFYGASTRVMRLGEHYSVYCTDDDTQSPVQAHTKHDRGFFNYFITKTTRIKRRALVSTAASGLLYHLGATSTSTLPVC